MAEQGLVEHIDYADPPFGVPPARVIEIHLPVPPSTNALWRNGSSAAKAGNHIHLSQKYRAWKHEADMLQLALGSFRGNLKKIAGKFEVRIIIARGRGDLDNRIKSVLDWAQSRGLIENDKHCERIVAEWGDAPQGCRLILRELA